jgi:hypothetical protein
MTSSGPEDRELDHSKLRHDLETARAYGEAHPDEWADLFVDNEPAVRMVMLFAGSNLETHERELSSLLSYPDQLEVRPTEYSHGQLREILEHVRLRIETPGAFHSLGLGGGRVKIWLAADQEELAASLLAQYGQAVELKVGNFSFPMLMQQTSSASPSRANDYCEIALISSVGLDVAISNYFVVESGRTGRGSLVFTNRGLNEVTLNTNGAITGRVVDPMSGEVIGGNVGAQTAPLYRFTVARDQSVSVPLLIGTASLQRDLGFAVPPGTWAIDAIVDVRDVGERRTPLLPIVIIDRRVNT